MREGKTSTDFTDLLKAHGIAISMGGKGCWRDTVFGERRWRNVKYEEVYRRTYESMSAAKAGLGYLAFSMSAGPISRLTTLRPMQPCRRFPGKPDRSGLNLGSQ